MQFRSPSAFDVSWPVRLYSRRLPHHSSLLATSSEPSANHRVADPMPLRAEFGCEPTQALAGPRQGRLRVAVLGRLGQSQQRLNQLLITLHQRLASTPKGGELASVPDPRSSNPAAIPRNDFTTGPLVALFNGGARHHAASMACTALAR